MNTIFLDKEFINATSSSDTFPFSKAFIHLIKAMSLCLCIQFNLILWGKHLLNHGTLKQCKPRSPTSSFVTGGNCKKSPAKITCKFPNKTDELLIF
jgi:hypothetical protein